MIRVQSVDSEFIDGRGSRWARSGEPSKGCGPFLRVWKPERTQRGGHMARNCRQHLGAKSSLRQIAIKRTGPQSYSCKEQNSASNCMILTEDLEFQKDTHPSES